MSPGCTESGAIFSPIFPIFSSQDVQNQMPYFPNICHIFPRMYTTESGTIFSPIFAIFFSTVNLWWLMAAFQWQEIDGSGLWRDTWLLLSLITPCRLQDFYYCRALPAWNALLLFVSSIVKVGLSGNAVTILSAADQVQVEADGGCACGCHWITWKTLKPFWMRILISANICFGKFRVLSLLDSVW